jgi:hypothetical protein
MSIQKIVDITSAGSFPSGGFDYNGQHTTFALQGLFNNAHVRIYASFADGAVGTYIPLTDSEGNEIFITEPSVLNIEVGRCRLKFTVVTNSGGVPDIEVRIS